MKIKIDPEKCKGVGRCVQACPEKAITQLDGRAVVDHARCDLDGMCIPACPHQAISIEEK